MSIKETKLLALIFIHFIFSNYLHSQNTNLILKFKDNTNEFTSFYNLLISPERSYWKQLSKPKVNENRMDLSVNYDENSDDKYFKKEVYKDFSNRSMYSNYKIFKHIFYVKETTENFNWKILDSTEIILGYKCQIAKTKFKGRTYFASFTAEIPISDGPWKFYGLPGLILKVQAEKDEYDNSYKLECVELINNNKEVIEQNVSFLKKNKRKFISWQNFILDVDKFINKMTKSIKSSEESGEGGYSLTINQKTYKEIFHKTLQTSGIIIDVD